MRSFNLFSFILYNLKGFVQEVSIHYRMKWVSLCTVDYIANTINMRSLNQIISYKFQFEFNFLTSTKNDLSIICILRDIKVLFVSLVIHC